jgi:hypothetical protein
MCVLLQHVITNNAALRIKKKRQHGPKDVKNSERGNCRKKRSNPQTPSRAGKLTKGLVGQERHGRVAVGEWVDSTARVACNKEALIHLCPHPAFNSGWFGVFRGRIRWDLTTRLLGLTPSGPNIFKGVRRHQSAAIWR